MIVSQNKIKFYKKYGFVKLDIKIPKKKFIYLKKI